MNLPEYECPAYFRPYLELVSEDILTELETQLLQYPGFLRSIPIDKELYRYAQNKWSIKEIVGHNTDTERIIVSRALRIARNDQTPIPGFNEDAYVAATHFDDTSMLALIEDFTFMRKGTISFYKSLQLDELKRIGTASSKRVSVRSLFYFMVGHIRHHEKIIKEKYL